MPYMTPDDPLDMSSDPTGAQERGRERERERRKRKKEKEERESERDQISEKSVGREMSENEMQRETGG